MSKRKRQEKGGAAAADAAAPTPSAPAAAAAAAPAAAGAGAHKPAAAAAAMALSEKDDGDDGAVAVAGAVAPGGVAAMVLDKYCSSNVQSVVFPGDPIALKPNTKIRLGPGLMQHQASVLASKAGVLRQVGGNKLWVDNSQKKYIPIAEDMVVGVVIEKHVENYRIDINAPHIARLPVLAFEGASKRNKPNIPVGALVYARVAVANKDTEPELTCISVHSKKDWVTGETLFGELQAGYCFKTSLGLARTLLDDECTVLRCLGAHIPFELAIGANGQVWLKSGAPMHTVIISNAILNSEHMSDQMIQLMVEQLVKSIA